MTKKILAARGRGTLAGLTVAVVALVAAVPGSGHGVSVYDPGDIIVADAGTQFAPAHEIEAVDPGTGAVSHASSGGSFVFPADVTFADDGDLLVVDRDAFAGELGGIIRVDSETAAQTLVSNNAISQAAGGKELFEDPIALDRKGDTLYVADFGKPQPKPKVITVDIATGKQSLLSQGGAFNDPFSSVAAGVRNPLVADAGAYGGHGGVIEINHKTGKQSKVSSGGDFKNPQTLVLDDPGSAIVADAGSFNFQGAIFRVDLKTGHQKLLMKGKHGFNPGGGIALLGGNAAAVSDCCSPWPNPPSPPAGSLHRVNLKTGHDTVLNSTDFYNPLGIRVAP
jgi:hypothetical protein